MNNREPLLRLFYIAKEVACVPRKTVMNDITSPELINNINPKNAQLVRDYLSYLKSVQRSETTIRAYENDLEIAMVWCLLHNDNKFFVEWTKRNIVAYQNWLIDVNKNSPARVRRLKATLSSLSNYIMNICDDEYPNFRNIINRVENPVNQPVREKTILSDEQIDVLLAHLVAKKKYDKACMVALAVCSGRRKSELVRFKVDYFKDENLICEGALYKTSEKIKTKGRGVNGKQIYCYTLAKKFKPYFDLWVKYRIDNHIDSEWLFPMKGDMTRHMSSTTLNSWSISFGKILGVDFYFHSLRHAWTTGLIRAGLPETVIKELAQWTNLDMVAIYNDCDAEEQFANYFKGGDINAQPAKTLNDL